MIKMSVLRFFEHWQAKAQAGGGNMIRIAAGVDTSVEQEVPLDLLTESQAVGRFEC